MSVPAVAVDLARATGQTPAMGQGVLEFVGRTAELAMLTDAIASARAGRGSSWLVAGEPGIGKSRLVEEVASRARGDGLLALWGRCWEAGGAPVFWPWIQILRAAMHHADPALLTGPRGAYLSQLVPELREQQPDLPAPPPAADHSQFALLDAVATTLGALSRTRPLLIAIEDLHVAAPSSLLLLEMIAHQVRAAPILLVGTYRQHEADRGEGGILLQRIAQTCHTIVLAPFERDETTTLLERVIGRAPDPALVDMVAERTEGNPLFLVELCRLLIARGSRVSWSETVPFTLRAAIQRRIAALSPATREILELASVIGRDVPPAQCAGAFARSPDEVHAALADAERAAIVASAADGTYRFTHVLIREVLYQDIAAARRQELELQTARWLATYGGPDGSPPWAAIAHHYAAAGDDAREAAIDAAARAAQQAAALLAYAEAITSYRRALRLVDAGSGRDPRRRAELMIGLGSAQLHAGDLETGRDTCLAAAALARELGAPDLLVRAALELGSVLTFARIDPVLVTLLEEAIAALPPAHDRLRARAMARLAAAMQPSEQPHEAIDLAWSAIELGRATGDRPTLLATLSHASSAMVDAVAPARRISIDREHVALAVALGDRVQQLRGHLRVAMASFELGDLTGARAAFAALRTLGDQLAQPTYRWRGLAAEATLAMWEGRFADAARAIEEAHDVGSAAGDPNAAAVYAYQTTRLARLTGRRDRLRAGLVLARQLFTGTPVAERLMRIYTAAHERLLGPGSTAPSADELATALADRASVECIAEIAADTADRALATAALDAIANDTSRFVSSGVVGMTWDAPQARVRALLERALGRIDQAIVAMTAAVDACRELEGAPMVAWTAHELASLLRERGRPGDAARADVLLADAERIATDLDMQLVLQRVRAMASAPMPAAAAAAAVAVPVAAETPRLELARSGELWTLSYGEAMVQLRDSKGLRYLARLAAEPGRELHVLDLGDAHDAMDGGDAGALLDAEARAAYRARIQDLEEQLELADSRNDLSTAERVGQELEFLRAELSRAVGLGGRERRAGSAVERARINVQRRLRAVIARVADHAPGLARHLERSVRTGVYCRYEPE